MVAFQITALHSRLINLLWHQSDSVEIEVGEKLFWHVFIVLRVSLQIYFVTLGPQKLLLESNKLRIKLLDLCDQGRLDDQKRVSIRTL